MLLLCSLILGYFFQSVGSMGLRVCMCVFKVFKEEERVLAELMQTANQGG